MQIVKKELTQRLVEVREEFSWRMSQLTEATLMDDDTIEMIQAETEALKLLMKSLKIQLNNVGVK